MCLLGPPNHSALMASSCLLCSGRSTSHSTSEEPASSAVTAPRCAECWHRPRRRCPPGVLQPAATIRLHTLRSERQLHWRLTATCPLHMHCCACDAARAASVPALEGRRAHIWAHGAEPGIDTHAAAMRACRGLGGRRAHRSLLPRLHARSNANVVASCVVLLCLWVKVTVSS